ncbi:MAG: flagellar biosynthesis protein FliQ [Deltaproteobacteria bacterium]|nr:flagellar biosynthesis protein FliQ [Deltaproteobacteria bacterium]
MGTGQQFIQQVMNQGLMLVILISGPPIVISMIVGIMISLFQAVTQIQEQTLTFVPKMLIIFGVLAALGPWFGTTILKFAQMCFGQFPQYFY